MRLHPCDGKEEVLQGNEKQPPLPFLNALSHYQKAAAKLLFHHLLTLAISFGGCLNRNSIFFLQIIENGNGVTFKNTNALNNGHLLVIKLVVLYP